MEVEHSQAGLTADKIVSQQRYETSGPAFLPDVLAYLQNETDLTRATLVRILLESGRLADCTVNPQAFIELVTAKVTAAAHEQKLDGIRYEPIPGLSWEMRRLEPGIEEEIERYTNRLYKVQKEGKTPYDHVEFDSKVEERFAEQLDSNDDVKYFLKLPDWFKVDTPVGPYNPDWAVVFEADTKLYLVRETKSTHDEDKRRRDENQKIMCARHHFSAIVVDYDVVTSMDDLVSGLAAGGVVSN
jgi:type III restriction enzyme